MDSQIWTEKYRPKKFNEFKGHEKIVSRVKAFVKKQNMPHILLAGPAGTGKSTLALVIAQELFGPSWKNNFLELNASDDRGIDIVRQNIKDFARVKSLENTPFKIIFLDECDSLTKEAQQALRRTMENYVSTTRFILSCNFSSKIIDPIQSRCTVFRFKPLLKEDVLATVQTIIQNEKIKIDPKAMDALFSITDGDLRRVTNILQSSAAISDDITEELVYDLVSAAQPKELKEIITTAIAGGFTESRKLLLNTMLRHGLSGLDLIKQIQKEIWNLDIEDQRRLKMIEKCGEIEFRMVEGSDEYVQLEALLASFAQW